MKNSVFLFLLTLVFVSCNNTDDHGHSHGIEPLAYTIYSDKMELFVEFEPLIVGTSSKFAAHFTVLGDQFTALSEGQVTVSLIMNGKGVKQTADAPSNPGIFRLALQPTVAGKGKLIFDIKTKAFTDKIVIDNVTVYPDEKTAMENQPAETGGGDITYLKEQAWKTEFSNMPVKRQTFSDIIKTTGQIVSAQGDEMVVAANSSGIVLFGSSKIAIGSAVSNGEQLFTISSGELTEGNIDARFKEAKANYENARTDYERGKELVKDKIISQRDFQQMQLEYENAQTIFNALAKNYSVGGKKISSPIGGFIKNIFVSEGQYVKEGVPIATVSQNRRLILKAEVPQNYFSKLPSIMSANFKTAYDNKVYETDELNGKVISYGKSLQGNVPFIPITFEIDNKGDIIPGSYVEIFLKTAATKDALVIPVTSLIEEQENFYVYVQTEGESFQKREVKFGASDGKNVQVRSGISEGERVVNKGAYQIKLSSMSGTMPAHGHEH